MNEEIINDFQEKIRNYLDPNIRARILEIVVFYLKVSG